MDTKIFQSPSCLVQHGQERRIHWVGPFCGAVKVDRFPVHAALRGQARGAGHADTLWTVSFFKTGTYAQSPFNSKKVDQRLTKTPATTKKRIRIRVNKFRCNLQVQKRWLCGVRISTSGGAGAPLGRGRGLDSISGQRSIRNLRSVWHAFGKLHSVYLYNRL